MNRRRHPLLLLVLAALAASGFYLLMHSHAQSPEKTPAPVVNAKGECRVVFQQAAGQGQFYYLVIKAASLPRRASMVLSGADGRHIGTISPYGKPPGPEGVEFTVSVAPEHVVKRTLNLVITIVEAAGTARPAKPAEVLSIETAIEP